MSRMTTRIQIEGDEEVKDAVKAYGFHLVESDNMLLPEAEEYEKQTYAESDVAEIYPYTSLKPFTYSLLYCAFGQKDEVRARVIDFWENCFTQDADGRRKAKVVTVYNDYKNMKIAGLLTGSPEVEEFEADWAKDVYVFRLTLDVTDPTKCNFRKSE